MPRGRAPAGHVLLAYLAALVLLLASAGFADAERPNFKISVSPKESSLGETVTVTVEIDLPGLSGPDRYWHPDTSQFRLVDSQIKKGTQTTFDAKLGQQLRTVEVYRYVIEPLNTGRLLIGPAKIRIGVEDWETRQVSVRVRATGSVGATTTGIGHTDSGSLNAPGYKPPLGPKPDVFLYAVADRETAWVGEQVTVSWLLFTRTEVLKYEPTPPRLSGLWSETLFEPTAFFQYSDSRIGSKDYVVAMVSKRALFATSPGKLEVEPLQAQISTVSTALGRAETIASNPLHIRIKELPDGAPAGFNPSYVGHFELSAAVDRDLIQAGQALTLSLKVAGKGAIRRTVAPRLSFPGFVFEEPRDFEEKSTNRGDQVAGERLYRYWTTPSEGGEQTIPPIQLPYFDPATGQYEIARSTAIGITVEGDPHDVAEAVRKSASSSAVDRDIRLLHLRGQADSRVLVELYRRPWFWWLLAFPPFAFISVMVTDRFRRRLKKETPRARLRRARGKARSHFRVAEIHLRGERPAKFFAELSHAIYAHMEEWLQQSMRSMTQDQMQEFLTKEGFDSATVKRVLDDLESFDRSRFAASAAGPEEMRKAARRTKELLGRVEKIRFSRAESGEGTQ